MNIIPWLEVNTPDLSAAIVPGIRDALPHENLLDYAMRGLRRFVESGVTKAIISTRDGEAARRVYPVLHDAFPDVQIIGGLKTFSLPGGYAGDSRPYEWTSVDGWLQLCRAARIVHFHTKSDDVVFDSETSLAPFHEGRASVKPDKARSLAVLPAGGVRPWFWYPEILPPAWRFMTRPSATRALVKAIAESVPGAKFIVDYHGYGPDRLRDRKWGDLRRRMVEASGGNLIDICYVTRNGHWADAEEDRPTWTVDTLRTHAGSFAPEVIVYPGGDWIAVAEQWFQAQGGSR